MTQGLSMRKVRAVSGAADRVFSLGNGLIIYAVAVVSSTQYFGQIAVLLTVLAAASGVLRGALGTPLLCAGRTRAEIRREGSFAVTTALFASPIVGGVMWAIAGPGIRAPAMLLIAATPVVLVENVLRYVAVAERRPHVAALWDGLWFAGSAALLVATWLHPPVATSGYLIGGWIALAILALIGMLASIRVAPTFRGHRAWFAEGWHRRLRDGAKSGLGQATVCAVLLLAAVFLSPGDTAALFGATALLAPVAIATWAMAWAVLPRSKRLMRAQVWSSLARVALVTSSGSLLIGVGLFFMPVGAGTVLFGRTFEAMQEIVLIIALAYAIAAWIIAVAIFLRAFNRGADALKLAAGYALIALAAAFGGAVLFRTAAGIAVGIATATTFIAVIALLRFEPWATPAGPDSRDRNQRVSPDLTRPIGAATDGQAAVGTITARDLPNAGVPRAMRLAMTLRPQEKAPVNEALITLWIFATLAVFVPAAIIRFTSIPANFSWLWSLPALAICAARFAWLIGNGERRLFEMMFWGYGYCFLCLAPLAQLRENQWPVTVPRVDATYTGAAALIVIVGCCAFLAGAGLDKVTLQRRWQASKRTRDIVDQLFTVNYFRTMLLCGFAILFNIYYLSRVGWIQFLQTREQSYAIYDSIWKPGSLGMMTRACTYMALLVALIALLRFRGEAKRACALGERISTPVMRGNMTLIVIIGVLLVNSMNPISNARYLSGTAMLAAGTAFGLFATTQRFRLTSCGFIAGLLFIFPLADAFRYSTQAELKSTNPVQSLLSPDYDSFAELINGYLAATREGIVPGRQFSGVLLFWLPRVFWTDKPVDTGIYIANERGYSFTNLSAPLWIEFYLNGGWLVLAVGMFALGFGLHRWDTRLNAQFDVYRMPGLLACILPFYMLILLRGSLLQAASYLFFILVFSAFVRQRKRKSAKTKPRVRDVPPEPASVVGVEPPRTNYVHV
ncbi:hypothetical protein [Mycobacterium sp. 852002-51057_SCH5723018]|uniref:hypothetical protein n=1 Tax=Mycobacterium sp. 852002-51057_SCH5723018 TaxID=1834094 RepID=UPI000800B1A9|nr:hypothetical protein [Mycobacterium sp. 852002-51057_SCH5723018]OBG26724.1 hypothetical protein A5764_04770 [Mycobacterium sp. 852002-51057_SCH5723018]